jgi:hypothetical protein
VSRQDESKLFERVQSARHVRCGSHRTKQRLDLLVMAEYLSQPVILSSCRPSLRSRFTALLLLTYVIGERDQRAHP